LPAFVPEVRIGRVPRGRAHGLRRRRLERRRTEPTLIPRRYLLRWFGPKETYRKAVRRRIAFAIAIASAGAAVATWQGEEHARHAEELDRTGFSQAIGVEQAKADVRVTTLVNYLSDYFRHETAKALQTELSAEAGRATGPVKDEVTALATAQQAVEDSFSLSPDVLAAAARHQGYRLDAEELNGELLAPTSDAAASRSRPECTAAERRAVFCLELGFAKTKQDLVPTDEFAASDQSFGRSNDLLADAALFILAAFFFTLAQISSRPRAMRGALAVGSAAGLAATALFVLFLV
jgi:hypothetical protein